MSASATLTRPSESPVTNGPNTLSAQDSPATPHLRAVRQRSLDALEEILQDKTQPARERRLAAASLLRYAAAIETLELRLADRAAERAERDADTDDDHNDDDSYQDDRLGDDAQHEHEDEEGDEAEDDFGPPPNPCPDDTINMQAPPRAPAQSHPPYPSHQSHSPARPAPNPVPRDPAHEAHLHQALRTARDLLNRQALTTGLTAQPLPQPAPS